jgi:glycosyltransferase involved in cell wall biosynthesis
MHIEMNVTIKSNLQFHQVAHINGESQVGLILSGCTGENTQGLCEGANYSTVEYLLCGLPVISTKSLGGREYWLNDTNSIICEPNEDSLCECVNLAIDKLNNGLFNREEIRLNTISKMEELRMNFIHKLQQLFDSHQVRINAETFFQQNYFHRLVTYKKSFNIGSKTIQI